MSITTEFDLIRNIKRKYGLKKIGDDCAVLPSSDVTDLVVTTDMLVENIDFRLSWTTPELLGHKCLAVSLSDIAAMGAKPSWAMLSIAVPDHHWKQGFVESFFEGWTDLARHFGVELVGGDISRTTDNIVFDSIAAGTIEKGKAILRSGAMPGDSIYVSGSLGGSAGGLRLLEAASPHDLAHLLVQRHLKPYPQLTIANLLHTQHVITSMIDISDGLSSDLHHICEASEVGATIDASRLPIDPELYRYFPNEVCFELALHGGEDFELLFTSADPNLTLTSHQITRIGKITANSGEMLKVSDGREIEIEQKGYRHF